MWFACFRTWLICLVVIFSIDRLHAANVPSVMTVEKLVVSSVDITPCFSGELPDESKTIVLTYQIDGSAIQINLLPADVTSPSKKCYTFNVITASWEGMLITMWLEAIKHDIFGADVILGVAELSISQFPKMPTEEITVQRSELAMRLGKLAIAPWNIVEIDQLYTEPTITVDGSDASGGMIQYQLYESKFPVGTISRCTLSDDGVLKICQPSVPIPNSSSTITGPTVLAATLKYSGVVALNTQTAITERDASNNLEIIVTVDKSDPILVFGEIGSTDFGLPEPFHSSVQTITMEMFALASSTDTIQEKDVFSILDCDMSGFRIGTTTLEVQWHNYDNERFALNRVNIANLTDKDDIEVQCSEYDTCFGYFINSADSTHTVTITSEIKKGDGPYAEDALHSVQSDIILSPIEKVPEISTSLIHLQRKFDTIFYQAFVCVKDSSEAKERLESYQLVIVDAQNKFYSVQGASKATHGEICFTGVTLDTRTFNVTDKVAVVVTLKDLDGRSVLASGQTDIYFFTPEIERVNKNIGRVWWHYPGNHTFNIRKSNAHSSSAATNLTCSTCSHYFNFNSGENAGSLLLEIENSPLRMTVDLPSMHDGPPGM